MAWFYEIRNSDNAVVKRDAYMNGEPPSWYDPEGGEWNFHDADPWHPDPHWNYNPWTNWNSPWQNVPMK